MTYGEENIVIDMVLVTALAIIFIIILGVLSVASVLGVVSVSTIIMGIRLWYSRRCKTKED